MLKIFYTEFTKISPADIHRVINELPSDMQKKILQYTDENEKLKSLTGKLLLQSLINSFYLSDKVCLDEIIVSKDRKPYFHYPFHFNIAHAEELVICAASLTSEIGIDTEKVKPVNLLLYEDYFTANEWKIIHDSTNVFHSFFWFWTRKEAIIKADGQGIQIKLNSFDVRNNLVVINNAKWYLQEIHSADGYVTHVACKEEHTKISSERMYEIAVPLQ